MIKWFAAVLNRRRLKSPDPSVRIAAAEMLGRLADVHAVEPLIAALRDEAVREAASSALTQLGDAAVRPLIGTLKDSAVRDAAVVVLGQLGEVAVEPLIAALRDDSDREATGAAGDAADRRRCYVARALGQLGDSRGVEPLTEARNHETAWVRRTVAEALVQLGEQELAQPVLGVRDNADIDALVASFRDMTESELKAKAATLKMSVDETLSQRIYESLKEFAFTAPSNELQDWLPLLLSSGLLRPSRILRLLRTAKGLQTEPS